MTEIFNAVGSAGWTLLGYIIPFLFILALVIIIHEMGHYLVGRWCGVRVEAFSVGFGKRLFGWQDKHGTEWKVCLIPLGGYVKFKGDLNAASMPDNPALEGMTEADKAESFPFKPVWQRAAIVAAGPIANFILALVIFVPIFMFAGHGVVDPVVGRVEPGSAAEAAGFAEGDRVVAIDGVSIRYFDDIKMAVTANNRDAELAVEVKRGDALRTLRVTPRLTEQRTPFGRVHMRTLGLHSSTNPDHYRLEKTTFADGLALGVDQSWVIIKTTVNYVGGLVMGREKPDQLSGPIRIAQVSGKVAEAGFVSLMMLAALLSVNIGFINLLPIPILDGGHLLFYAIEAVFRRPLHHRAMELSFKFGLALLVMLMVFSTINDIVQIRRG